MLLEGDKNEIAYMFKVSFKQVSFYLNINIMHKEKGIFFKWFHFILMQKEKSMFLLIKLVTGR